MRLSFSTRGWPDLTWDEMVETALEMGFSGIEVYNLPKFEDMLAKGGPFHPYQIAATVRDLREKKLTIPCLDTSCDLSSDPNAVQILGELIEVAKVSKGKAQLKVSLQDWQEAVNVSAYSRKYKVALTKEIAEFIEKHNLKYTITVNQ